MEYFEGLLGIVLAIFAFSQAVAAEPILPPFVGVWLLTVGLLLVFFDLAGHIQFTVTLTRWDLK